MELAPTTLRTLPNGLTVVVQPRPDTPVAGFFVFYRVGSRNEGPGQTGLSHFLEHMAFKTSAQFPWQRYEMGMYRRGTTLNAFTSLDTTCYWEVLPREHLETAVAIEGMRMGQVEFDPEVAIRERTIIVAEREGGENRPGYLLTEAMLQTAFQVHPYGHMVIGSKDDIRAVTADALQRHYRTFYRPDNAVAVIVGAIDPEEAVDMVARHMGRWPAGGPVPQEMPPEPVQTAQRRIDQHRPAPVPEANFLFKVPGEEHPDTVPLQVLAALLGGVQTNGGSLGRSSRLYRAVVQSGLAAGVSVGTFELRDPQPFWISVTGRPETEMARVEEVIWRELERVAASAPPAEEVERARQQLRAQWVYAQETVMGLGRTLGLSVMTHSTPEAGIAAVHNFLAHLDQVRPEDLQRVAAAYLRPERATVGVLHPAEADTSAAEKAGAQAEAEAGEPAAVTEAPSRQAEGEWGETAELAAVVRAADARPAPLRAEAIIRRELPGGTLLIVPMAGLGTVVSRAYLPGAGSMHDPADRDGLARLTATVLTRGFAGRDPSDLDDYLDSTGISLRSEAGVEGVTVSLHCLASHHDQGLELLTQAIMSPDFPEAELDRARQRLLTAIRQHESSTSGMAGERLYRLAYPEGHPYSRPSLGLADAVRSLTRAELVSFHRQRYGASPLIVVMAGDVDPDRAAAVLSRGLAGRAGGEAPAVWPECGRPAAARAEVGIPGKSQSDIALGFVTVPRRHPDWMPLRLLAAVLGNPGLMSRLFKGVREHLGLSYSQYAAVGSTNLAPAVWTVRVGCATRNVPVALAALELELERLRTEPVPDPELRAVQDRLINSLTVGLESPDAVAGQLLELERLGLRLDYLERYPDLVRHWAPADLLAAAQRHLDPGSLLTVIAGPRT